MKYSVIIVKDLLQIYTEDDTYTKDKEHVDTKKRKTQREGGGERIERKGKECVCM